jgi:hypothetical protein
MQATIIVPAPSFIIFAKEAANGSRQYRHRTDIFYLDRHPDSGCTQILKLFCRLVFDYHRHYGATELSAQA